ncbi:MAG: Gfo/Idh/MocA family protein [Verrucomicrobiota bacterium]
MSLERFLPVRLKHAFHERVVMPRVREYNARRAEAVRQRDAERVPHWQRSARPGPKTRVRIGVAGAGQYAQHHLKALDAHDNVEIAALLTRGGPSGPETAAAFSVPTLLTDLDAFAALDVDAFLVVVSAAAVFDVSARLLATGKPVLLEKPPGVSAAETESLIRTAEAAGTWGMVGLNRRFYSIVEHGLAALGDLGAIRGAIVEVPQRITSDRRSGRLTDWDYDNFYVRNSIHGVDLIRYVLGDPLRVHSRTWPNADFGNRGASYAALLEYGNGVFGEVLDLWDTPDNTRLSVIAEAGRLELEPPRKGWVEGKKGRYAIPVDPVDDAFRTGIWAQDLHFVEAVRSGGPPGLPAATLQDALGTMRLIEAILADSLAPEPAA